MGCGSWRIIIDKDGKAPDRTLAPPRDPSKQFRKQKIIELYEVLKALDNLKIAMNWSLETGWENKTKAIALTCLCKTSTPLLMNLCPQLPKKVQ